MILLDTNVVSAMMRLHQEPRVQAWLTRQNPQDLYTSAPTIFEVQFGISTKPPGRRKRDLETSFQYVVATLLRDRVLILDKRAALFAGDIRAAQRQRGITPEIPDSLIAGVALTCGAAVATRNTADFTGLGLALVDPWQ